MRLSGQPERDPGRERLVGGGLGGGAVVPHEHELRVAAGDPDFDAPVVELARELERRLAERLLEAPAEGRLERDGEQLGRAGRRLVADGCDADEIVAECLDVPIDLHDRTMTSQ